MFTQLLRNLGEYLRTVPVIADRVHSALFLAMMLAIFALLGMAGLNIYGHKGFNLVIMLVSTPILIWQFIDPRLLTAAGGLGAGWSLLMDTDKTQGAAKGIGAFLQLGILVVYLYSLAGLTLATWEIGSWKAFGLLAGGGIVVCGATLLLGFKGKTIAWMGLLYGTVVIAGGLLQSPLLAPVTTQVTSPVQWVAEVINPSLELDAEEPKKVRFEFYRAKNGSKETRTMSPRDSIHLLLMPGAERLASGVSYWPCARITNLPEGVEHPMFLVVKGAHGTQNLIVIDKKGRFALWEAGVTKIEVEITLVAGVVNDCLHTQ